MSTMITGEAKKSFKAIVVKELPEKGILNNLYFVLNGDEGDNKYDEYIWVKDPDTQQYMWEKVGYSYVDLTPYYTKEEVNGKLSPINNNLLKLNTETTFHPVININQIKPGGGQGTNKDRWTIDQAVLAAWEWINEDLTNRGDYLSPGISIMFRSTNLRDVNGFDGAWLIHNYSDVDFSQASFTNPDKWCRVLTEADFKFEAADETYSGFLLNTDYIKFNNAVKSITAHATNYNNPHQVTKNQVGLGNVDNTSDLDKPLSNNDKQALNLKIGSISIGSNAGGGLKLGLWGAKVDGIVVGGQSINKVDLGTVVIPNVTADQDGLFPAAKLASLDSMQQQIYSNQHTIGQLNQNYASLSASVNSIVSTKIPQIQDNFDELKSTIGTSVINIDGDNYAKVQDAINYGYSFIRHTPNNSNGPITIINEGDGNTFVQYKYEGGKQYRRKQTVGENPGSWELIGPINSIHLHNNSMQLGYFDGSNFSYITSVVFPVIGSDTGADFGLFSSDWFNIFKDNTLRSTGISYQANYIDLGTIDTKPAYLNQVTTETAGILSAEQWKDCIETNTVAYTAQNLAKVSISSIVPTPSSDRITLKLKQNNGDTSNMPLGLVNTTNAGLMSPTDKSKLDGIESLDSSDITALFS